MIANQYSCAAFVPAQKAYDSVDRPTLWAKLKKMGFGGAFLRTLQRMYEGDYVTTEINGVVTRPVYLKRGLRQGCSLSPMLFALYVVAMGQDLAVSGLGITMYKRCVSAIFFAVRRASNLVFTSGLTTCFVMRQLLF
jgi:hypothetical protein